MKTINCPCSCCKAQNDVGTIDLRVTYAALSITSIRILTLRSAMGATTGRNRSTGTINKHVHVAASCAWGFIEFRHSFGTLNTITLQMLCNKTVWTNNWYSCHYWYSWLLCFSEPFVTLYLSLSTFAELCYLHIF